jgi:ATP-dependent exoDNAse (exonuclease V) beta subunit
VLCRTNGEVLFLSGLLGELGVDHSIRRAATDATPPAWIAERLANVETERLRQRQFGELVGRDDEWTRNAWRSLRRLAGDGSSEVSLQTLRQRLSRLNSDEAADPAGSAPVLSTVHRSKGLEYDTVVILESALEAGAGELPEEARVLYVAMTRARRRTIRLERPDIPGRLSRRRSRWTLSPWRGGGTSRLELRIGDVSPSLESLEPEVAQATQAHLRAHVHAGDPVNLRLQKSSRTYALEHQGQTIATTRETFAPFSTEWPRFIEGLRVDRLRTEAGDPTRTANLGLGPGGFWLVPEIIGLGRLTWEDPVE